jgi:hypothetical protein
LKPNVTNVILFATLDATAAKRRIRMHAMIEEGLSQGKEMSALAKRID